MPENKSMVVKLIVVITLCVGAVFALALGVNYIQSRTILEKELENNARSLALSLVNRIETELASVSKATEGIARALENVSYSEGQLHSLLRATLEDNPGIYGSAVAFEPYAFDAAHRLYAPYYFRSKEGICLVRLEKAYRDLPYLYWDWYQIPHELGRKEWSEPYFDDGGGNIVMSTCSVPFYRVENGERRMKGIVTADVHLDALTEVISSVTILKTGYAALLSRNGTLLAHPLKSAVMNDSFFSIAEERRDPALRRLGKKMVRGESGFVRYKSIVGVTSWMYYAPIRSTGWTLAVVFPEVELLETVGKLTLTMSLIGFAGIVLLTAVVYFIASTMIRPLRSLASATRVIASGNFDVALPQVRSNDEIGVLAASFQSMTTSLKDYIRTLTETTAAKERIQGELKIATDIQASLLPRIFPAFPERPEFDVFASMDPAKEVGGDFYDFFFIDDRNLCFLVADVADKGVPAALYMMVAKTLLKSEGQRLGEPDQILSNVNNILAADNESSMFATVFCAILDTFTGEVRFANAGHNPPVLVDAAGVRLLAVKPGMVLGPIPDSVYTTERMRLQPGNILFLYTDGVTEAKNTAEEFYGEARLLQVLQDAPKKDVPALIHHVRADVARYAQGAPQSDDVTMLAICYRGAGGAGQAGGGTPQG